MRHFKIGKELPLKKMLASDFRAAKQTLHIRHKNGTVYFNHHGCRSSICCNMK